MPKTLSLSLFPHKTWVPSWLLYEGTCHGNVLFSAVQVWKETHYENYRLAKGKLTQNLVLFQLVQDLIDRSNLTFKASKLILNHRKNEFHLMTLLRGLFQNTYSRATQFIFHLSTASVRIFQNMFY